jgi:hypothetical protein
MFIRRSRDHFEFNALFIMDAMYIVPVVQVVLLFERTLKTQEI